MQHLSNSALIDATIAERDLLGLLSDSRQVEVYPVFPLILQEMPDQIIDVQSLLYDDDYPSPLVVEPGGEGGPKPANSRLARRLRHSILGFQWIIDNDVGSADAGQCPANRGGVAKTALGGEKLDCVVLL